MTVTWVRGVTGVQLHHVTDLADASRFLVNATAALRSANVRTGDSRFVAVQSKIRELLAEVGNLEDEARARLHSFPRDQFTRCRDGEEPWPDEIAAGFIPRHTCRDRCLYHDMGVLEAIMQCICARPPCRACDTLRADLSRPTPI